MLLTCKHMILHLSKEKKNLIRQENYKTWLQLIQ